MILSAGASFLKHGIQKDYLISYKTECNPLEQSCFKECEDDACTTSYDYAIIERPANELFNECGKDIINCDYAHTCGNSESCTLTFCNPNDEESECVGINE